MMNNNGCKGYVMKALNKMIKEDSIDYDTARMIMIKVYYEFDFTTESEAEDYYCNNSLIVN